MSDRLASGKALVAFDLDGTLIDSIGDIRHHLNAAFADHGIGQLSMDQVRALIGHSSSYLIDKGIDEAGAAALNETQRTEILAAYNARYLAKPVVMTRIYPGMLELLEKLNAKGLDVAVISNKPDPITGRLVDELFPSVRFVRVQGFLPEVAKKPDPEALLSLMDEGGYDPRRTVYVGDSEVDLDFGYNASVYTISVDYGFRTREALLAAGAAHLASDAGELLNELMNYLD